MKKILCITASLAGGGAEHQMAILCNLLQKEGYQVTLLTYADVQDHYTIDAGIERVKIAEHKSSITKLWLLCRYILKTDAECVISYLSLCNMRVMIPALFRHNITYIVSERNTTVSGRPDKYEKWNIDRGLYKSATYIVANSKTQAEYLKRRKPEWTKKIKSIINYTDLNQFQVSKMPDSDVIRIAIFARLAQQKNPVGLVNMLRQLKARTLQSFKVDWYCNYEDNKGNPTPEYLEIKNHIEKNEVEDVITIKKAVKNPAEFMDQYHAICLPSLYEGFSNSIAEGICSAKPMLVSDVSDNSTMVHDGVNGFLFDPKNIESMVEAFLRFFDTTSEQKQKMANQSRLIAEELFDEKRFINEYIKLIEK